MLQKLLSRTRKAIADYDMIREGDKIAVGVSGGKDSLALLCCMKALQGFCPNKFDLVALTLQIGLPGFKPDVLRTFTVIWVWNIILKKHRSQKLF